MIFVISALVLFVAVTLTVIAVATLWWMSHAWGTPESFEGIKQSVAESPQLSFSLIVPCRDESEVVMSETIRRLLAQDHPDFEVLFSLGHDDHATIHAARNIAARNPDRVRVSIDYGSKRGKPAQLNSALQECTKAIVGIIDAESLTQPGLLRRIDSTFRSENADIVQGAVHLVNLRSKWFSLRNCLEYRIWFRSRLHGHANEGFVPLGGNTVFIWREILVDSEVDGWDTNCLAEDAEIGVRLSVMGAKTVCLYDANVVTQEETPDSTKQFVKQRTRWSLGFMQVLAKGEWRKLPTRWDRTRAVMLLAQQFNTAFSGLVLPLAVVSIVVGHLPVIVVILAFIPLVPSVLSLVFEMLALHEFGKDLGIKVTVLDQIWLVVSTPPYQILLAVSSLRAVVKYIRDDFHWEKTSHVGAHIDIPRLVAVSEFQEKSA